MSVIQASPVSVISHPFPVISWWACVLGSSSLNIDVAEQFRKMTLRNRYKISGSNKPLLLTVPIENGREQRSRMCDIKIFNREKWQIRHWRTLESVYRRTPFFEHYEASLKQLFIDEFTFLADFNLATVNWLIYQLAWKCTASNNLDSHTVQFDRVITRELFPKYYQVFEDRIGFQPDLSLLDLLFSLGPETGSWLHQHKSELINSDIIL
jgi:hypothetical protein